jgi:hypothetical protein
MPRPSKRKATPDPAANPRTTKKLRSSKRRAPSPVLGSTPEHDSPKHGGQPINTRNARIATLAEETTQTRLIQTPVKSESSPTTAHNGRPIDTRDAKITALTESLAQILAIVDQQGTRIHHLELQLQREATAAKDTRDRLTRETASKVELSAFLFAQMHHTTRQLRHALNVERAERRECIERLEAWLFMTEDELRAEMEAHVDALRDETDGLADRVEH